jgi:hypothetical protein
MEGRPSFLKKRSKKLLFLWLGGPHRELIDIQPRRRLRHARVAQKGQQRHLRKLETTPIRLGAAAFGLRI